MISLPQILSLARAGNPARAWALFRSSGWDERTDDPKALTLKGRLLKDRAKAAEGTERARLYGEAAEAYAAAAGLGQASYPLINAATLALLGGKLDRSRQLAREVLRLLDADPEEAETVYWQAATRSEAMLLLGDDAGARAALAEGVAKLPRAWEDHAATIGQFELILAEQGLDAAWLDRYRPPPSFYFSGIIGLDDTDPNISRDIDAIIARERPGFAFGALAAGADILIAEALHAAGVDLHITLPYPVDRFCELSVAPYGDHWIARFETLIEAAVQLDVLTELPDEEERSLALAVELADLVAMGQCIRNAGVLKSRPKAVSITGAADESRRQHQIWAGAGHDQFTISVPRKADHHSITETPSSNGTRKVAAMLWVDNPDPESLMTVMEGTRDFQTAGNAQYLVSSRPSDLLSTGRALLQADADSRISLLIDVMDPVRPVPSLLAQAGDIARASSGGSLLTDYRSAMALTVLFAPQPLEEIGELQTANGPLTLWSIA